MGTAVDGCRDAELPPAAAAVLGVCGGERSAVGSFGGRHFSEQAAGATRRPFGELTKGWQSSLNGIQEGNREAHPTLPSPRSLSVYGRANFFSVVFKFKCLYSLLGKLGVIYIRY